MPYNPGDLIGDYTILELLGIGGNGEVYRAQHATLHNQAAVAVKVLHVPLTAQQLTKFMREAQHLAALKHAHILTAYEYFSLQNSVPVLVTEYASKGSLRDVFDKNPGSQPLAQALPLIKQIGEALQYAHDQKIVHRDVKPDNILINEHDDYLLCDFGLAVVLHATVSRASIQSPEGTPLYRPDEQSRHKAVFQSDQYAFACTIWEWLTGKPPFTGDPLILLLDHRNTIPDRTKLTRLGIPENVIQALMRALNKDPKDRFPRIEEFIAAVTTTSTPSLHTTQVLPLRPAFTQVRTLTCQHCDTENQPYDLFCEGCGASLQGSLQVPITAALPVIPISPQSQPDDSLNKIVWVINRTIQRQQKTREQYFFEWAWIKEQSKVDVTNQLKDELVVIFKAAGWGAFRHSGVDRGGTPYPPGLVLDRPKPNNP